MKEFFASLVGFIERLLDNSSLWFWLLVYATALIFAGVFKLIEPETINLRSVDALILMAGFLFCLWMHSLRSHSYVSGVFRRVLSKFSGSISNRREQLRRTRISPLAKNNLTQLIRVNCAERRWLLWFIEHRQKMGKSSYFPYGEILYDINGVHGPAKSLFAEGLLHRSGDSPTAIVFFHNDLYTCLMSELDKDSALRKEINQEWDEIRKSYNADVLKSDLSAFRMVLFMRSGKP